MRQEKGPLFISRSGAVISLGVLESHAVRSNPKSPSLGKPCIPHEASTLSRSLLKLFQLGNKQLPSRPFPSADPQTLK